MASKQIQSHLVQWIGKDNKCVKCVDCNIARILISFDCMVRVKLVAHCASAGSNIIGDNFLDTENA